jgi:Mn2+/Fe2+ NRAMP family transporter
MVQVYGVVIVSLLMWSSYRSIARVFKWLTLVLLAYVLTAFVARVDWRLAVQATVVPHLEASRLKDRGRSPRWAVESTWWPPRPCTAG